MTDQEKLNLKTNALHAIQSKIDNDLASFKDAIAMHCSRVINGIVDVMEKNNATDENKNPQAPDEV